MSETNDAWSADPDDPNVDPKGAVFFIGIIVLVVGCCVSRQLDFWTSIAGFAIAAIGVLIMAWSLR